MFNGIFAMDCSDEAAAAYTGQQFNPTPIFTTKEILSSDEDEWSLKKESFFSDEREILVTRGELFECECTEIVQLPSTSRISESVGQPLQKKSIKYFEHIHEGTKNEFPIPMDCHKINADFHDDINHNFTIDKRITLPLKFCSYSDCPVVLKNMKRKNEETSCQSSSISTGYLSCSHNYASFSNKHLGKVPVESSLNNVKSRIVQQPMQSSVSLFELKLKHHTSHSVNRSNSFTYIFRKDNRNCYLDGIAVPLRLSNLGCSSFLSNRSTFSSDYRVETLIRPLVFPEPSQIPQANFSSDSPSLLEAVVISPTSGKAFSPSSSLFEMPEFDSNFFDTQSESLLKSIQNCSNDCITAFLLGSSLQDCIVSKTDKEETKGESDCESYTSDQQNKGTSEDDVCNSLQDSCVQNTLTSCSTEDCLLSKHTPKSYSYIPIPLLTNSFIENVLLNMESNISESNMSESKISEAYCAITDSGAYTPPTNTMSLSPLTSGYSASKSSLLDVLTIRHKKNEKVFHLNGRNCCIEWQTCSNVTMDDRMHIDGYTGSSLPILYKKRQSSYNSTAYSDNQERCPHFIPPSQSDKTLSTMKVSRTCHTHETGQFGIPRSQPRTMKLLVCDPSSRAHQSSNLLDDVQSSDTDSFLCHKISSRMDLGFINSPLYQTQSDCETRNKNCRRSRTQRLKKTVLSVMNYSTSCFRNTSNSY